MPHLNSLDVIRDAFGRVVYTQKAHEKERFIQARIASCGKLASVILITLSTGGLITVATLGNETFIWVSLCLSTLATFNSIFQFSFDPADRANQHRSAAKSLLAIKDRYIMLIADIKDGIPQNDIRRRRDELELETAKLYELVPDTSKLAYRMAKRVIEVDGEASQNAEDIDRLLPPYLRSSNGPSDSRRNAARGAATTQAADVSRGAATIQATGSISGNE